MKGLAVYIIAGLLLWLTIPLNAQARYRVYFKDKQTTLNPHTYFDGKAISRRIKNHLPLTDSTDFPVNPTYVNTVSALGDSVGIVSRWFNFMAVYTNDVRAAAISKLSFVSKVEKIEAPQLKPSSGIARAFGNSPLNDSLLKPESSKLLKTQIDMMQGHEFAARGINGKGIRIAIFDAGFPNVDNANVFADIVKEHRIIDTYNFGRKCEYVYAYNPHGAMVMGCIGGRLHGRNIGLATGAEFMLAITENASFEAYKEEENWLAAAEWADKNGADIINSSLGYTDDLYFTEDMTGRKSLIGRAATMAVKKGILVVSAAGNEGDGSWQIVASPGDVDSVLTVGAVNPHTGYHANYSSYGPNRNMHLKPNVSAPGTVLSFDRNHLGIADGTSFASPLVAGFAACVLQMDTTLTNVDLYKKLEESASLYPYFDYAHGYGIPQAGYFTGERAAVSPTFSVKHILQSGTDSLVITLDPVYFSAAKEKKEKLLYYHVQKTSGVLEKYYVMVANNREIKIANPLTEPQSILRIHYKGYTYEYIQP